jgi:hypothetical protein
MIDLVLEATKLMEGELQQAMYDHKIYPESKLVVVDCIVWKPVPVGWGGGTILITV